MFELPVGRPALMGILNVTPDSFSDGGIHFEASVAIEAGLRMMDEGADLIDVGGESTRPGAADVPEDEEIRRTIPVVQALVSRGVPVSIDTTKPGVAVEALQSGAKVVNDVSALSSLGMAAICREFGCTVCLMHMQGTPRTMQVDPQYDDVVEEVRAALGMSAWALERDQGIRRELIWVDPGIGFGKTVQHNLQLLKNLDRIVALGYPVLVGVSRKSFIGRVLRPDDPVPTGERLAGTLAAQVIAQLAGARILRAHDVAAARKAIALAAAVQGAG